MVVTSSGRVGINNFAPDFTLDVSGTGRSNYLYNSGIYSYSTIQTQFDLSAEDDLSVKDDATINGNMGIGALYIPGNKLKKRDFGP